MHPRVWEASGHVVNFNDPMVDCKTCKARFRADHLIEDRIGDVAAGKTPEEMSAILQEHNIACPNCGNRTFTDARQFNMMFSTTIGPVSESGTSVYLRPETAQAMFVQYKNLIATSRVKLPFGAAQIGKAFRNEITPGNFIFRDIEFEQMEIEYFVKPGRERRKHSRIGSSAMNALGRLDRTQIATISGFVNMSRANSHTTRAGRSISNMSFPVRWAGRNSMGSPTGVISISRRHQEFSGEDLRYFDQEANDRYLPHVIEPTFGVDRTALVLLLDAYDEESTFRRQWQTGYADSAPASIRRSRPTKRRFCP